MILFLFGFLFGIWITVPIVVWRTKRYMASKCRYATTEKRCF